MRRTTSGARCAPHALGNEDDHANGAGWAIVPVQRLEFGQALSDQDGKAIDPARVGTPPDSLAEMRTVVVFPPRR